jgi:hypothetical protein
MTATRKTGKPEKLEPKPTLAPMPATVKSKKKAAASVKTAASKSRTRNLEGPAQSSNSPLKEISDLLYYLPLQTYVEVTCRPFTSNFSLLSDRVLSRTLMKSVVLFVAEYSSTPNENRAVLSPGPRLLL